MMQYATLEKKVPIGTLQGLEHTTKPQKGFVRNTEPEKGSEK